MRPTLCFLLCFLLGACGANDEDESELITFKRLASDGVRQYLEYYCGCYGSTLGYADEATCVDTELTRFPINTCDAAFAPSNNPTTSNATLEYLACLDILANLSSACLVSCDTELILDCAYAFALIDEGACDSFLTETQREALRDCLR